MSGSFGSASVVAPKGPMNPKLRSMRIKYKRESLGIPPDRVYTAEQALGKALEAEDCNRVTSAFHPNKEYYIACQENWLELAALLDEEERESACV